jgi:hypothetical protein
MMRVEQFSSGVVIVACVAWAAATAVVSVGATARIEYALAAREARAMAEAMRNDSLAHPMPRRRIVAEGSITRVRIELTRFGSANAARVATDDRVLVHRGGFRRAVSIPIKDREQRKIIGAIALEAEAWQSAPLILLAVAALAGLAATTGARGIGQLADDPRAAMHFTLLVPVAALALGTAAITVLVRIAIEEGQRTLAPPISSMRVQPLALQLPDLRATEAWLAAILAAAVIGIVAAGWAAAGRRRR